MATAKKCDICGEFYLPYDLHNKDHTWSKERKEQLVLVLGVEFSCITQTLEGQEYPVDIDLCPDCTIQELASLSKKISNKEENQNG